MEETGILEKTEQSDSCYLGLNQVRNFRNLNESEPDARPVPVKVDPVQADVGATKWVAPSSLSARPASRHRRSQLEMTSRILVRRFRRRTQIREAGGRASGRSLGGHEFIKIVVWESGQTA